MRRTPLKRYTRLQSGGSLRRTGYLNRNTRINPRNEERCEARRLRDFGPLADYVIERSCCRCSKPSPSEPAHVRSRGAGGHSHLDNGDGNIIPFCRDCHQLQHDKGWSAVFKKGQEAGFELARWYGRDFEKQGANDGG